MATFNAVPFSAEVIILVRRIGSWCAATMSSTSIMERSGLQPWASDPRRWGGALARGASLPRARWYLGMLPDDPDALFTGRNRW